MWSRWTSSCDPQIMFKMMFTDHLESVLSNFEQIFSGAEGENFGFLSKIFSMDGPASRGEKSVVVQVSGAEEAWEAGISCPKLGGFLAGPARTMVRDGTWRRPAHVGALALRRVAPPTPWSLPCLHD